MDKLEDLHPKKKNIMKLIWLHYGLLMNIIWILVLIHMITQDIEWINPNGLEWIKTQDDLDNKKMMPSVYKNGIMNITPKFDT